MGCCRTFYFCTTHSGTCPGVMWATHASEIGWEPKKVGGCCCCCWGGEGEGCKCQHFCKVARLRSWQLFFSRKIANFSLFFWGGQKDAVASYFMRHLKIFGAFFRQKKFSSFTHLSLSLSVKVGRGGGGGGGQGFKVVGEGESEKSDDSGRRRRRRRNLQGSSTAAAAAATAAAAAAAATIHSCGRGELCSCSAVVVRVTQSNKKRRPCFK